MLKISLNFLGVTMRADSTYLGPVQNWSQNTGPASLSYIFIMGWKFCSTSHKSRLTRQYFFLLIFMIKLSMFNKLENF